MSEVTLKNAERRPFLATVYHDIACRKAKVCTCSVEFYTGPNGKRVSRKNPMSFQVDAMSTATVPASVLHLPQVKQAIKSGWLKKVGASSAPVAAVVAEPALEDNAVPRRGRR